MNKYLKYLTVNSETFEYYEFNEGKKQVLIFLHSLVGTKESFLPLLEFLGEEYHCIAIDLRGHGNSTKNGPFSFEQIVNDIKSLVKIKNFSSIILVACSFSCIPAQIFATKYPNIVKDIVLIDGGFFERTKMPDYDLEKALNNQEDLVFNDTKELINTLIPNIDLQINTELLENSILYEYVLKGDGKLYRKLSKEAYSSYFKEYAYVNLYQDILLRITCPVLLLLADTQFRPYSIRDFCNKAAEKYKRVVKSSKIVVIPNSLHSIISTNPSACGEAIRSFFMSKPI